MKQGIRIPESFARKVRIRDILIWNVFCLVLMIIAVASSHYFRNSQLPMINNPNSNGFHVLRNSGALALWLDATVHLAEAALFFTGSNLFLLSVYLWEHRKKEGVAQQAPEADAS